MNNVKKISKYLSLILRHHPEKIGLVLDGEGWTDVDELLDKLQRKLPGISRDTLDHVVAENDKQRFRFDESGTRIRANQGHSIDIALNLEPSVPPDVLLHGTVSKFLGSIVEQGLLKGSRQHVHLTDKLDTAEKVGVRRGKPIILKVDAERLHKDETVFFLSDNGVWLKDHVPPDYVSVADVTDTEFETKVS